MSDSYVFFFTDIEADGPLPGKHSMISLASVARDEDGNDLGEFEQNISPMKGYVQDPKTMQWWSTQNEAWKYSTANPEPPEVVMDRYAKWVSRFDGIAVLAAHPATFDYMWVSWYSQHFLGKKIFDGPGLDIVTYAMATFDWKFYDCHRSFWPEEWFGGYVHTHKAIEDARGYANAFFRMVEYNSKLDRSALGDIKVRKPI